MGLMMGFEPHNMIDSIPCIKVNNNNLMEVVSVQIKDLLHQSEEKTDIVRMARGEGRTQILNEIVSKNDVLFDWGMKGRHAFLEDSPIRDFLEPNNYNKEILLQLLDVYREDMQKRNAKTFEGQGKKENDDLVDKISNIIVTGNLEDCQYAKDWICTTLHTAGNKYFKNYSAFVSTACGQKRYKTAFLFGNSRFNGFTNNNSHILKRKFVIFDYWESKYEEGKTFIRTETLIAKMKELGLPWYNDIHKECMVRFALYPQQLVGYYYIENDEIIYYELNPHYMVAYENRKQFSIGDYVYIEQDHVRFPASNPYRQIYSKNESGFDVHDRR